MGPEPALHRVMPARRSVAAEWILPYDDVLQVMLSAKVYTANDCICRVQQDHLGHRCGFPRGCASRSPMSSARPGPATSPGTKPWPSSTAARRSAWCTRWATWPRGWATSATAAAAVVLCCGVSTSSASPDGGPGQLLRRDPPDSAADAASHERLQVHAIPDEDGVSHCRSGALHRLRPLRHRLPRRCAPSAAPARGRGDPPSGRFRRLGAREAAPPGPAPGLNRPPPGRRRHPARGPRGITRVSPNRSIPGGPAAMRQRRTRSTGGDAPAPAEAEAGP